MAHLFQPKYTRPVPPHAKRVVVGNVSCARWTARGGKVITAPLMDGRPDRCTVTVDCWYLTYTDHEGREHTEKCFNSRRLSERRMHDVLDRIDGIKANAISPAAHPKRDVAIAELLDRWKQALLDKGDSEHHAGQARHRAEATFRKVGISRPAEIDRSEVAQALAVFRRTGVPRDGKNMQKPIPISAQTSNHYLRACKAFTAWLVDEGFLDADPLSRAKGLTVEGNETFTRRELKPEELDRLVLATAGRTSRCQLPGPDRAAAYLAAFYTGFRLNEVAALTPEMFQLAGDQPCVVLPARYTLKKKRDARQFLPDHVAAKLKAYLKAKPAGVPVWGWARNFFAGKKAAGVLRKDLAAAKIPEQTVEGWIDFHALRTSYITALGVAGVPLQHVQKLARHSDPRQTAKYYLRVRDPELVEAVKKLLPAKPGKKGKGRGSA